MQWKNKAILSKTVTGVKKKCPECLFLCVPCNFSDLTGFIRLPGLSTVKITLSDVTKTCFYYMSHCGANYFLSCLRWIKIPHLLAASGSQPAEGPLMLDDGGWKPLPYLVSVTQFPYKDLYVISGALGKAIWTKQYCWTLNDNILSLLEMEHFFVNKEPFVK